eukprot:TRINITY_DN1314_c0_g1_i10.p1 TRINITY_DN1314_c0_g1~~TRINITY_DN1314_c0_g1_i10.p1  ORF type:complete len:297 (-),score=60.55 TRINITY_DN1314_c0_g1_i10:176-1066(-)
MSVDITKVHGSGHKGRVLKDDIHTFVEKKQPAPPTQAKKPEASAPPSKKTAPFIATGSQIEKEIVQMSDFQKGMQKSMTEANNVPHFYYKDEIDVTELFNFREELKKKKNNISVMSFLIKSFSLSLNQYPILNAYYDVNKPFEYSLVKNHNISIAIDSPKGLVVPNIKNCQILSVLEVQQELDRLKKASEQGTLGPKELYDGTISISNIGNIGGTYLGPLVLPPQVCIVAIGKTQVVPKFANEAKAFEDPRVVPRRIMNVSFGCDHRVLDGATVARFAAIWKNYLENPLSMTLHMR